MRQELKEFFVRCAQALPPHDKETLECASAHWLRHSHGSHALAGPDRQPSVPLKNNLGHASLATTSGYIQTEQHDRLRAMEGFFQHAAGARSLQPGI